MGATPSPPQSQEYSENIGAEFGSEGAELKEVSKLPLEEVEVSELPSEKVLGEALGWKECMAMLEIARRGLESKELQRCQRSELEKLQDTFGVKRRSSSDTSCVPALWYSLPPMELCRM